MKLKIHTIRFILFLNLLILLFSGCDHATIKEEEDHHHHDEAVSEELVNLTPIQFKTVGIQLGTFDTIALKNLIKASGRLDLPPQNKATVSTLMGGLVSKIYVIQGDKVKKGQILATIENPEVLRLQQSYLEAKSNLEYARKEYQRQKELYEEKIVAGKKFEAAEAEYEGRRALINSLENQLLQVGISPKTVSRGKLTRSLPITAPISGYIHEVEVNTGQYVEPAKEIFEIVDNHHIHVDLKVYEKDIPKVKVGQKIFFNLSTDSSEQYMAEIFSVGKAFDNESRSVGVHAEIINNKNDNLLPGMYVNGRIQVEDAAKVPALPESAVVTDGNQEYIFMKTKPAPHHPEEEESEEHKKDHESEELTFKKIPVITGVSELGKVEVTPLEKLPYNAIIVTDGAYYLNAQMNKGEGGHGH